MKIPFTKIKEKIGELYEDVKDKIKRNIYKYLFLKDEITDLLILLSIEINSFLKEIEYVNKADCFVLVKYYLNHLNNITTHLYLLEKEYNIDHNEILKLYDIITEDDSQLARKIGIMLLNNEPDKVFDLLTDNYHG